MRAPLAGLFSFKGADYFAGGIWQVAENDGEQDGQGKSVTSEPSAVLSFPDPRSRRKSRNTRSRTRSSRFASQNTATAGRRKPSTSGTAHSETTRSSSSSPSTTETPCPHPAILRLPALYPYQRRLLSDPARDALCVSATQVGKTFALACWIIAGCIRDKRSTHPSWWVAPTYNQIVQGFRLVGALARSAGILDGAPVTTPYPMVKLISGALIEFRSWEREQNLMGTTIARAVVDEAGLLTPEAQAAISSRRSQTMGPIRYIGNPGTVAGPFRKLCNLGEQAADPLNEWHGVYSLHRWTWKDKFAALADAAPARAQEYARFIEQERQSLPEFEFRRLYEAEWTEDEAAVFRNVKPPDGPALVSPAEGDRYVIGVDVAQQNDYLVATIFGINRRRVDALERWRGIPYPQSADRLQQIAMLWGAPLVIEVNGPGLPLYQELQQRGVSCVPFTTTGPSKQEIITRLASELAHGRLTLADVPPLQYELKTYRYERMPGGNYRYSAPAGEHDDCVMSLALALWGASTAPDLSMMGWVS